MPALLGAQAKTNDLNDGTDMLKSWEYMHASAGLDSPENVSFYEEEQERLYRDVDLNVIGSHGWELVSVVMVPNEEGVLRYEFFFKRPRPGEAVTLVDRQRE